MAAGRALALLVLLALAGCAGREPAAPGATASATGSSSAPPDAGAPPAGGAAAPEWPVGQWWTWRLDASAAADGPLEATTVVLAADAASYSVGATNSEEAAQVYPFHLVGLGSVARDTLAWQAHGLAAQFLRFPVVDGDSWAADFWGAPGATVTVRGATVEGPDGAEPGYRSEATYNGGGLFAAASWSPTLGQFVKVQTYFGGPEPFATATLVAHGLGGKQAQPFVATDIVRLSANPSNPPSLAPVDVTVPAGSDLVVMACFLGGGPGSFQVMLDYGGPPVENCVANTADSALYYAAVAFPANGGGSGRLAVAPAGQGSITVELFGVDTGDAA